MKVFFLMSVSGGYEAPPAGSALKAKPTPLSETGKVDFAADFGH
jgi:hypothetical protein